jgi:excisionase family DNA binding protein
MNATVTEIANDFRVSKDAVYAWVRSGVIPADCVDRVGATIRIRREEFGCLLRAGKLMKRPGRQVLANLYGPASCTGEDSHTTRRHRNECEHRWQDDNGSVNGTHPYGPGPDSEPA